MGKKDVLGRGKFDRNRYDFAQEESRLVVGTAYYLLNYLCRRIAAIYRSGFHRRIAKSDAEITLG